MRPLVSCLLTLFLIGVLLGCGADPGEELKAKREAAELQELGQLKGLLTASNDPLNTDVQVFLSKSVLNEALKQFGEVKIPIPEMGDAVLTVSNAQVSFSNGYPGISLKAEAESVQRQIKAECSVNAILFLDVAPAAIDQSTLRVVLTGLAPKVKTSFFQFSVRGFWDDLATLVAQNKLKQLPSFSVPLAAKMPTNFGGAPIPLTIPTGNGSSVTGQLTIPQIASEVGLQMKHVLFLEDGIHLYLNTEVK